MRQVKKMHKPYLGRLKNPQASRVSLRPTRSDEEYEEPYEIGEEADLWSNHATMEVEPNEPHEPVFTGILTSGGKKLYRFFPDKNGVGFLTPGVEDYDPDTFTYGFQTDQGPIMLDELMPEDEE